VTDAPTEHSDHDDDWVSPRRGKYWSWVATPEERDLRIQEARRLEGMKIERVRYFDLDYNMMDEVETPDAPRFVTDPAEWTNPNWRCTNFDSVDFFVEFTTVDRMKFTVGWGEPFEDEGIWIEEVPDTERFLHPRASVAIWDVTTTERWSSSVNREVEALELSYVPSNGFDGFTCELLTLRVGREITYILMGSRDANDSMIPSSNNLLIVSPPTPLPGWIDAWVQ
jgi:hypothetical protein